MTLDAEYEPDIGQPNAIVHFSPLMRKRTKKNLGKTMLPCTMPEQSSPFCRATAPILTRTVKNGSNTILTAGYYNRNVRNGAQAWTNGGGRDGM